MVSFIIGFDMSLLVIEISLFLLLVYMIKKYERTKEKKVSLFNWLMVVVIYLLITNIVSSIFK